MEVKTLSASQIKAEALRLGFSACGMAPAEPVNTAIADAFSRWQAQGMQANMNYMGNYLDKRLDPRLLMEGVRTILSVALNYYPARQLREDQYQFAWYAYGKDYHDLMKTRLTALQAYISAHSRALLGLSRRARLDRKKHPAHHSTCRFLLFLRRIVSRYGSRRIRPATEKPVRQLYPMHTGLPYESTGGPFFAQFKTLPVLPYH